MALEDYRSDMEKCSWCSYCKWIPLAHVQSWRFAKGCPSIEYGKFHSYSNGGRYATALALLDGKIGYSDKLLEIFYKCQVCGSCDVACKVCRYLEPLEAMLEMRARLVGDGEMLPEHMAVIECLRKEDNMMMKPRGERSRWMSGLDIKDLTQEKAEVVYHAGCHISYTESQWEIARTALNLIKNAGVDIGIMAGDESCCGGRAYDWGYQGEFTKFAENNIEAWKNARIKTVVTSCADCYYTFKRLYPTIGSKFKVLHISEYVDRLIKEGKVKFTKSIPMTVTYSDPCRLGRLSEPKVQWQGVLTKIRNQITVHKPRKPMLRGANGVYDPPRDILKSIPGLKLIEMERIREYAWCCGAGGGVKEAYPDFALWTAKERIEEARCTGAEAIATACPWCESIFTEAINGNHQAMKVYDIIELVQQAI
jgi:Fe-S oxidoreductase